MRRRHDNWERRDVPGSSYDDREEFAKSPLRRIWFPALLGGVGVLGLAVIVLPYLVDWIDSTSTARRVLVATPLVPSETPISLTSPPLTPPPAPQKPEGAVSSSVARIKEITPRPESPLLSPAGKREPVSTIPPAKVTVETAEPAVESSASSKPRSEAPGPRPASRPVLSEEQFWVQVGAFKDGKHAARFAAKLAAAQYPVVVRRGGSASAPHVVRVGRYPSRERAEEVRDTLEAKGFRGFILRDDRR
ncbi:MAG: SPOR domain-containing protein [Candidatus Methylomirabilia bacterium]